MSQRLEGELSVRGDTVVELSLPSKLCVRTFLSGPGVLRARSLFAELTSMCFSKGSRQAALRASWVLRRSDFFPTRERRFNLP